MNDPRRRRRILLLAVGLVLVAMLAGGTLVVLYARGGGPVPDSLGFLRPPATGPLSPSGPAEVALRTLRLAGFDRVVAGQSGGTAVVRVEMPEVRSAAKVELSWQTALVAGAEAFPYARTVTAQLFAPGETPLLEVSADAAAVRTAAERDDAASLRRIAHFRYLPSAGGSQ